MSHTNVALYLVTHEGIASSLLKIACDILKKPLDNISYIEIEMDAHVEKSIATASIDIEQLDRQHGLIICTDFYGSTPSNIAQKLSDHFHTHFISGINLPMLVRLLNYRDDDINTLTEKALDGGRLGIQQISSSYQKTSD